MTMIRLVTEDCHAHVATLSALHAGASRIRRFLPAVWGGGGGVFSPCGGITAYQTGVFDFGFAGGDAVVCIGLQRICDFPCTVATDCGSGKSRFLFATGAIRSAGFSASDLSCVSYVSCVTSVSGLSRGGRAARVCAIP